jgi:polyphenol oxidase
VLQRESNGLVYLQFENLLNFPKLQHATFTRHGGDSAQKFDSLNLGYFTEDNKKLIYNNIDKVSSTLGIKNLHFAQQVHTDEIAIVDSAYTLTPCDVLATQEAHRGLMIQHADCQATIIYDPKQHVVANVHCGWKGNILNIYEKTVEFMKDKFGSQPENLYVGIAPSLGPNASEFKDYKTSFPEHFWEFQVQNSYFNLWEIARQQLIKAKVLPEHIEIAELCTYHCSTDFFSYRKENLTGRNGTIAALL